MTKLVTDTTFQEEVLDSSQPVLIDFWAEWCGPCRMLSPVIDELSNELQDSIKVMKLNIDENPNTPSSLGIRGIPTMMLFKDGKQVAVKVGVHPKDSIKAWIEESI